MGAKMPKPLAGDQGRATDTSEATSSIGRIPPNVKSQTSDERFSFRWGIPLLDCGFTTIPNFFYDCYSQAGVTGREFLAIQHLARYQYDKPDTESRPSVATVARQMGYKSERYLQRIFASLEERGLLVRHYRTGASTVYDFSGFSRAMLALSTISQDTITGGGTGIGDDKGVACTPGGGLQTTMGGGLQTTMGGGLQTTMGVAYRPPEEQHGIRTSQQEKAAAGLPQEEENTVTCSIHNCLMERRSKGGHTWYSHRLPDGTWCKGGVGDNGRVADAHVTDRGRYAEFHLVTVDE